MFKKSDPWQAGIKIFSKFFGFDTDDDSQVTNDNKGANGLMSYNGSNPQALGNLTNKYQQKTYQLKQKWRKLMKFQSKAKHRQVIELLRQGSAIQDETWVWMLKNSQKISPQLYRQRKQQFMQIAYPKHPVHEYQYKFPQSATQIQEFEEQPTVFGNSKLSRQQRRRKFSITKNGLFLKQGSNLTGRTSMNSQCSTFSSQTHNSNEGQQQYVQGNNNNESSIVEALFCSKQPRLESPQQSAMKSSFMSSYSTPTQPFSMEQNYTQSICQIQSVNYPLSQIHLLPQKITHPVLTPIIGAFLVHRQDFSYSITVFNMAATFFYYTNSSQIKTFMLLNHCACSQFFVQYLTKNWQQTTRVITWIAEKIKRNPALLHPLRNFKLQNFIENWLYGFFYSICENGSDIKEKLIGYLLVNNFTIEAIANVCESLVLSLMRIISQGFDDRTYECLQNPKMFIDKKVLFDNLLRYED